jgi:hypothetical protein
VLKAWSTSFGISLNEIKEFELLIKFHGAGERSTATQAAMQTPK